MRTFGVEEELLIADPVDGMPLALAADILDVASLEGPESDPEGPSLKSEFKQEQIEVNSLPCRTAKNSGQRSAPGGRWPTLLPWLSGGRGLPRWLPRRSSMPRRRRATSATLPWARNLV